METYNQLQIAIDLTYITEESVEAIKPSIDAVYTNGVEEAIFKIGMCLPAGPYVTDDDVRYIVDSIKEAIE